MADAPNAFVVGHPIGHSRSPLIHRYWLAQSGLAGRYEALDIAPEDFGAFVADLAGSRWAGGNVTIPHKQAAFAAIENRDAAAQAVGAVNTIWRENGELRAGNTDAYGFSANLDAAAPDWHMGERALVVGAGGACAAILHALIAAGYNHIDLANRTVERAGALADRFGKAIHPAPLDDMNRLAAQADLIVNTTALGMKGKPDLTLDFARAPDYAVVCDIVYTPLMTPFLRSARDHGLKTVDGLGMLLHQAVPGFERWFGRRPNVTEALREHVLADLEKAGLA